MAKKTNEYFLLIEQQAAICVEAAALLENILTEYSAAGMAVRRVEMHAVERRADGICHDIRNRLSAAFITPIDQEDILHLAQLLDDVTDALDEVALECYMFRLAELPAGAPAFAGLTHRCVGRLCEAAIELRNFRSSGRLRALLAEVNTLEEQADDAYATAIHDLFAEDAAPRTLIAGKAIFDCMEACCDLCGHAADVMDQIIIKNT
jgi:phosphate transport regulator (distant homolog of phoU)